jgi:DNA-directed RNA polymerase specialized sigma24 family protein
MGDDDTGLLDFVATRYPQLRRSAFLMCGDWAAAGEVVREVLARVVADLRRDEFEDPGGFAYAELMAAFPLKHKRREHVFVAPPEAPGGHDPTETILLLDALQKLAPRCRAVLVLRHWDGLPVTEVADVLNLTDERVEAYDAAGCRALESLLGDPVSSS